MTADRRRCWKAEDISASTIPPPNAALPAPLSYLPLVTEPLVAAVPESWVAERQTTDADKGAVARRNHRRAAYFFSPARRADGSPVISG